MEDDHVTALQLSQQAPNMSLFGVYDGHGGKLSAQYTAKNILPKLTSNAHFQEPYSTEVMIQAITATVMALDDDLRELEEMASGRDQSGTTSCMVLVSPSHVVGVNSGDSRAVLCRKGDAIPLSYDHKPFDKDEKERIEKAGGSVKANRVNGDLAVSRALGDFMYKQNQSLPAEEQAVTALPDLVKQDRHADDEFFVVACDGIWDVMSNEEVVQFVRQCMLEGPSCPLVEEVRNMSVRQALDISDDDEAPQSLKEAEQKEEPDPLLEWNLGVMSELLMDHCLHKGSR